ncbi:hypothetical protein HYR54_12315 [Candidatus Acetothermia bacterium]|nr:hypothetical protein [Candidatus Acetothermia bacterium]
MKPTQIVIEVSGGVVQNVFSSDQLVKVIVLDFDTDDARDIQKREEQLEFYAEKFHHVY